MPKKASKQTRIFLIGLAAFLLLTIFSCFQIFPFLRALIGSQENTREDFFIDTALSRHLKEWRDALSFSARRQDSAVKSYSPNFNRIVRAGEHIPVEITVKSAAVPRGFFQKLEISLSKASEDNGQYTTYRGNFKIPSDMQNGIYGALEFSVEHASAVEIVTAAVFSNRSASVNKSDSSVPKKNADGTYPMVELLEQAETYAGGDEDNKNTGLSHYPAGTADYVCGKNDYTDSKGNTFTFLTLGTGRRVCIEANTDTGDRSVPVRYYNAKRPDQNVISHEQTRVTDSKTEITLNSDWGVPIDVTLHPQLYTTGYQGRPYNLARFSATYLDIRFHYTALPPDDVVVKDSPLFESASWVRGKNDETILRLHFVRAAEFFGYALRYDDNGKVVLSFRHKPVISKAVNLFGYSLKGVKISLDAGHGGKSPGAVSTLNGVEVYEKDQTRRICDFLIAYLESMGATVQNVRKQDDLMDQAERSECARAFDPDLLVSIHLNANDQKTLGAEGYYYYPFSQPLANALYESLEAAYPAAMGYKPPDRDMRVRFYPFAVTRVTEYPSVLMELGFMDNPTELVPLCDPTRQKALAKALAEGILNFLK